MKSKKKIWEDLQDFKEACFEQWTKQNEIHARIMDELEKQKKEQIFEEEKERLLIKEKTKEIQYLIKSLAEQLNINKSEIIEGVGGISNRGI